MFVWRYLRQVVSAASPLRNHSRGRLPRGLLLKTPPDLIRIQREADKVGNVTRYALATDHPVAQALVTLDNLVTWVETLQLPKKRFIGESGDE